MLSETVSFGASSNSSVVSVVVVNDDVLENDEVFVMSMSVAIGQERVDLAPHNAIVSIINDDGMKIIYTSIIGDSYDWLMDNDSVLFLYNDLHF